MTYGTKHAIKNEIPNSGNCMILPVCDRQTGGRMDGQDTPL